MWDAVYGVEVARKLRGKQTVNRRLTDCRISQDKLASSFF